jgi:hypothetical protein
MITIDQLNIQSKYISYPHVFSVELSNGVDEFFEFMEFFKTNSIGSKNFIVQFCSDKTAFCVVVYFKHIKHSILFKLKFG